MRTSAASRGRNSVNLVVDRPDLIGRAPVPVGHADDDLRPGRDGGNPDVAAKQHLTEPLGVARHRETASRSSPNRPGRRRGRRLAGFSPSDALWDTRETAVVRPSSAGDQTRIRHVWEAKRPLICVSAGQGPVVLVDVKGLEPMASRV
jgi:hypothetical protein